MKPLLVAASAITFGSKSEIMGKAECEDLLQEYRVGKRRVLKLDTQEYQQMWACMELVGQRKRSG